MISWILDITSLNRVLFAIAKEAHTLFQHMHMFGKQKLLGLLTCKDQCTYISGLGIFGR